MEKVTGGWRTIINLSILNGFVTLTKFQMKMVASVLGSIKKWDWMFLIDLKDAYFQIPVHPESWPYLWFCLEGRICQLFQQNTYLQNKKHTLTCQGGDWLLQI